MRIIDWCPYVFSSDLEVRWSGRRDSNPRPHPWQLAGLPFRYLPILRYPTIFTQFIENLFDLMYPAAVPIFRKFGDTLETLAISEAVSPAGGEIGSVSGRERGWRVG